MAFSLVSVIKKSRSLMKFTMFYLCLLFVIVLLGISTFLVSISTTARQTEEVNTMILKQTAENIDNSFNEANYFTYTASGFNYLQKLMLLGRPFDGEAILTIREAMGNIPPFSDGNRLIVNYQIYLSNGDFIVQYGNTCLDIDRFYGKSFSYGDMTVSQWRQSVLKSGYTMLFPAAPASIGGTKGRMLLYVRNLSYLSRSAGRVIFYVDENALQQLFSPLYELSAAYTLILDKDGVLLSSHEDLPETFDFAPLLSSRAGSGSYLTEYNGQRMLISYARLSTSGCIVASATPYQAIVARASAVLKPMIICIILLFAAGLALTYYGIRITRRPLMKTMELLAAEGGGLSDHGFKQLDQAVHQLVTSHHLLARRLEEQRMELRTAIVASLESGDTLEAGELDILLSHVGIQPEGDRFRGVYLIIPDDKELNSDMLSRGDMHRALVIELLEPFAPHIRFLSLKNRNSFILLYAEYQNEPQNLNSFFTRLYQVMRNVDGLEPYFYVGTECSSLCYLPHSLLAARQLILKGSGSTYLSIADEQDQPTACYYYSEQQEKKLISLTAMGREEEVKELLEAICAENTRHHMSRFCSQMLYYKMVGTLSNLSNNLALPEELTCSLHKLSTKQFFGLLESQYMELCRQSREKQTEHTSRLIQKVLAYIDANYTDYTLTLTSTAQHFGITDKYLSAFIHEKAGINFSSYLEQLRIRKANELLENTDKTVDEIAQMIGYANGKTFRRAYSRVTGIAPSEHRNIQRGSSNQPFKGEAE
ncbi:MAG: helix-turn-helix domain-containing protein [Clostridiales bacterium]|nr:helix-turn-helix domain-containing protein [Clostridiales bacterium]